MFRARCQIEELRLRPAETHVKWDRECVRCFPAIEPARCRCPLCFNLSALKTHGPRSLFWLVGADARLTLASIRQSATSTFSILQLTNNLIFTVSKPLGAGMTSW